MKKILLVIAILVLGGIALVLWNWKHASPGLPYEVGTTATGTNSADPQQLSAADLKETYSDQEHSFTFKYSSDMTVVSFPSPDGVGTVITASSGTEGQGFQIVISPFDEPITALTVERIKQDVPDLVILEPQEVLLGSQGKGVAFKDGDGPGAQRQVWFIARGNLYQITAPISFDQILPAILNTWVFK